MKSHLVPLKLLSHELVGSWLNTSFADTGFNACRTVWMKPDDEHVIHFVKWLIASFSKKPRELSVRDVFMALIWFSLNEPNVVISEWTASCRHSMFVLSYWHEKLRKSSSHRAEASVKRTVNTDHCWELQEIYFHGNSWYKATFSQLNEQLMCCQDDKGLLWLSR